MVTTMRRPSSAKKPRVALITLGTAVILVSCVFQVVSEHDKEAAEQRWQAQLIASDLFGRNPQTVIAFLDHHHLYHSAYEKAPYNASIAHSPGYRVDYDRRIFVEFGPVAHTFDLHRGRSDWYIVTDFNFGCDNKLGGWTSTSTPKKVQDGEVLCCVATPPYCHP